MKFSLLVAILCASLQAVDAASPWGSITRSLRFHGHTQDRSQIRVEDSANATAGRGIQQCGVPVEVTSSSGLRDRCPEQCPLYVDAKSNGMTCDFTCVSASSASCAGKNARTPVVDEEMGFCRSCEVVGCLHCLRDGTERCSECLEGYVLDEHGRCEFAGPWLVAYVVVMVIIFTVVLIVLLAIAWIVELLGREAHNKEGLRQGLALRSRAKLHQPKQPGEPRQLWPVYDTNLCKQDVAGPAVKLLFNFQAALICWAFVMALTWFLLGHFVDGDLLIMGTRPATTPREECIIVKWGYETQRRLMHVKIGFLTFAYLFSLLGAMMFGVMQLRRYQTPGETNTHKDFCMVLTGLPAISGERKLEEELAHAVQSATGVKPVGVSVGWDTTQAPEKFDDFQSATDFTLTELGVEAQEESARGAEDDQVDSNRTTGEGTSTQASGMRARMAKRNSRLKPQEAARASPSPAETEPKTDATGVDDGQLEEQSEEPSGKRGKLAAMRKRFGAFTLWMEAMFIHPTTQKFLSRGRRKKVMAQADGKGGKGFVHREEMESGSTMVAEPQFIDVDHLEKELRELQSSATAFVVFDTQADREDAIRIISEKGFVFEDCSLETERPDFEPSAVLWTNLSCSESIGRKLRKMGLMFLFVLVMILLLCTFESIYAKIQVNNVYATGTEGVSVSVVMFTLLVAGVMACLCLMSAEVSDRAGFERVGQRETCFVLLYTFSVVVQVSLDLVIAYIVGKRLMEQHDTRTYDGTQIRDLSTRDDFREIFTAYGMQKQLGVTVLSFGFPCAFLVPFLAEPIVSIYLPYKIMTLIVRSHPEIKGASAEGYLEAVPMDLGRYGDLMINVIIATLILFFPGGFNVTMFTFLFISHCYIYVYDHHRILGSVQTIYISTFNVDWWAQWLFSIPCALMLTALSFKANCEQHITGHVHDWGIEGLHCHDDGALVLRLILTFFGHIALHTFLLLSFVPLFSKTDTEQGLNLNDRYLDTAQRYPCSWFSGNMIHCLRSDYIYNHDPPQDFCVSGKEHLMRRNDKIGAYFTDDKAETEEYRESIGEEWNSIKDAVADQGANIKQSMRGKLRTMTAGSEAPEDPTKPPEEPKKSKSKK